jgi:hypothetical protein
MNVNNVGRSLYAVLEKCEEVVHAYGQTDLVHPKNCTFLDI